MKVQCVICDEVNEISDETPLAKKLKNRPIHTYMCDPCYERVKINTEARLATGKFRLYRTSSPHDEEF